MQIDGIIDHFLYRNILENNLLTYADRMVPQNWTIQQNNDPKHISKPVKEWFTRNIIDFLQWSNQFSNHNPIEHL